MLFRSPSNAYLFVPGKLDISDTEPGVSSEDISERFRRIPEPPMAAGIMANNIRVAFYAFALGITGGVGTCFVVVRSEERCVGKEGRYRWSPYH